MENASQRPKRTAWRTAFELVALVATCIIVGAIWAARLGSGFSDGAKTSSYGEFLKQRYLESDTTQYESLPMPAGFWDRG